MNVCAVDCCGKTIRAGMLMCWPCWGQVPPPVQKRVYQTLGQWRRAPHDTARLADYQAARTAAIEHMAG